jgi:hypothetical protein
MKKTLSLVLALIMLMTSALAGITASADTALPKKETVQKKVLATADALVPADYKFTINDASDLWLLISAGKDMSAYKTAFVKSVVETLESGNGKIATEKTDWAQDEGGNWVPTTTVVESPVAYAAVMLVLDAYDIDITDVSGTNLKTAFSKVAIAGNTDSPNVYGTTLAAAEKFKLGDAFITSILNELVNNYYVMGSGLNFYGFSSDNLAYFVKTVYPYKDKYQKQYDNAVSMLENCKVKGGYYSTADYGDTAANADSTGLMLAAYSTIGNREKAAEIYKELLGFEVKDGQFGYESNKEYNAYATKDALTGLIAFYNVLPSNATPLTVTLSKTEYTYNGKAKNPKVTVTDEQGNVISADNYTVTKAKGRKNVGKYTYLITFKNEFYGTKKKSFKIKPSKSTIKTLNKGSKSFTVKWTKKTKQVDGYQLYYSTSKKFAEKYTVKKTIKSNKTVKKTFKKLKGNKKYYIKVRTYKVVDGTKYYSEWSDVKTVKTKK